MAYFLPASSDPDVLAAVSIRLKNNYKHDLKTTAIKYCMEEYNNIFTVFLIELHQDKKLCKFEGYLQNKICSMYIIFKCLIYVC